MELAPSSWFITHYIRLWSWWPKNVMQVKNLAPYLFMTGVQEREVLCRLAYPFKCSLVLYVRGIIILHLVVWTLGVGSILLDITYFIFGVVVLALYVTFYYSDHFRQHKRWLLGERLIKMSRPESILECSHKYLLVWWDNSVRGFLKVGEVVSQRLWWTQVYVEHDGDGHFHVVVGREPVYKFFY